MMHSAALGCRQVNRPAPHNGRIVAERVCWVILGFQVSKYRRVILKRQFDPLSVLASEDGGSGPPGTDCDAPSQQPRQVGVRGGFAS